MKKRKILIIGGVSYSNTKNPRLGGTTILMDNFIEYCNNHNIPYFFISTNRFYGKSYSPFLNTLFAFWGILNNILRCKVTMVNISSLKGTVLLLPFIAIISRITCRKYVFRMFAGNLHLFLEKNKLYKKIVFWCVSNSKKTFVETKELIGYFEKHNLSVQWFPNVRKPVGFYKNTDFSKRCVFMSHIKEEKGINELIELRKLLPSDYTIDLYGSITDPRYTNFKFDEVGLAYKGQVLAEKVPQILINYDILLLPTNWYAEGYPGIIIEALSVGIPCVSTYQGGIPEIIEDGYNGRLYHYGNIGAFKEAVLSFNNDNYKLYSNHALKSYNDNFNSDLINNKIVNLIIN